MGLKFSKTQPPAEPGSQLTDVVHMAPLLDKLSMRDLRQLAKVNTD